MVVGTRCPSISGLTWLKGDPCPIPSTSSEVLVLEFWATWCPPCKATIPHLTAIQKKYQSQGVRIIGISTDEDASKASQFVKRMGPQMDYTVAMDTGRQAYQLMSTAGAHGIPHAFIVDREGIIRYSGHPADPSFESALKNASTAATAGSDGQPAPPPSSSSPLEQKALPLITESREELMARSNKELKAILSERKVDARDCLEKSDLVDKILATCTNVTYYA